MKHARQDYDRIQDPAGKIPEDEPVFLIRGQDRAGPATVRFWASEATRAGARPDIVQRALQWADEMEKWQLAHGNKVPDMPTYRAQRGEG